MYILDEEYLQIETKENKLIYYTDINIIPTEKQFEKIKTSLINYFTAIEKTKKNFYQIMKIDNATVSSIYSYTTIIQWICNFFSTQHHIFDKYLKCTIIIIDNVFIQGAINLVLKAYQTSRPVHFITDLDKIDDLLALY